MWDNKIKAVTFSIDDGCESDKKVVEIFNKYGIKGTFNLNSGLLNTVHYIKNADGAIVEIVPKMKAFDIKEAYVGHEVAVHTCLHPNLTTLTDSEIIKEIELDRKTLTSLVGYDVVGMAYPCGDINNDERVAEVIRKNTPIFYARTIISTYSFDLQTDLMRYNPTIWWGERDVSDLVEKFLSLKPNKPQILYIWGHAFELDRGTDISYDRLEDICKTLSNKSDVFYGTNKEVLIN